MPETSFADIECNATVNSTCLTEMPETLASRPLYHILLASLLSIAIILVGIVGNFSVIWVICRCRTMRASVMNLYILNMAIADFTLNMFGIPEIIQFMLDKGWVLGEGACKVSRFIVVSSLYLSVLSLLAVTIERSVAIIRPMQARSSLTHKRILIAVGSLWLISIGGALPTAVLVKLVPASLSIKEKVYYCQLDISMTRRYVYKYLEFSLMYAIPLVVQVVLFALIFRKLRQSARLDCSHQPSGYKKGLHDSEANTSFFVKKSKERNVNSDQLEDCVENDVNKRRSSRRSKKTEQKIDVRRSSNAARSRRHVIRMLFACVLVYFISYTPPQVFLFFETFNKKPFHDTWPLRVVMYMLGFINSSANPVIYYMCSASYKTRLRKMYSCARDKDKRGGRLHQMDSTFRSSSLMRPTTTRVDFINSIKEEDSMLHSQSSAVITNEKGE